MPASELIITTSTPKNFIRSPKGLFAEPVMVDINQVIPKGTVMGVITATGLAIPYLTGAVDGSQVPAGLLAYDVDTTTNGANRVLDTIMYVRGLFYYSMLILLGLDSGAITAFGGRHIPSTDTFILP